MHNKMADLLAADAQSLNGGGSGERSDTLTISSRASKRKGSEWEILGNLEKGVHYTIRPKR